MNIRNKNETANTITVEWDPVPGQEGVVGIIDGSELLTDGKRHFSGSPALQQIRFAKVLDGKDHSYGVKILGKIDSGYVISGNTPNPVPINFGQKLPSRLPESTGAGGDYYVDPANGNDSSNGSSSSPWKTLNKALASIPLKGSIIHVKDGVFVSSGFNSIPINWNRNADVTDPVTLVAENQFGVKLIASGANGQSVSAWLRGRGLRIRGFSFAGSIVPNSSIHTSALAIEASNRVEIDHCSIFEHGSVATSIRGPQAVGASCDDIWFTNCIFRPSGINPYAQVTGNNFPKGTYYGSRGSHWIYAGQWGSNPSSSWDEINGCRRFVVINCIFVGSTFGRAIELGPEARDCLIVGNTFYGNHAIELYGNGDWGYAPNGYAAHDGGGVAVQLFANASAQQYMSGNNIIKNNLFVDLDGHAVYGSGPTEAGNFVDSNLSWLLRNGKGYQGRSSQDYEPSYGSSVLFQLGSKNVSVDPLFVDPLGYDFHLATNSPARGLADPDYLLPTDFDGHPRLSTPAVGAYS